jgi:hypothetical protein
MNCDSVMRMVRDGDRPLPMEALEHLQSCAECSVTALFARAVSPYTLSPDLIQRLSRSVVADLLPIRPLRSDWTHSSFIAAVAAMIIAAGVTVLGHHGWSMSDASQRLLVGPTIGLGLLVTSVLAVRLMTPGRHLRLRPEVALGVVMSLLMAYGALYPSAMYRQFGNAVAACFLIGLAHALPMFLVIVWILRRGYVTAQSWAAALAGQVAGLTGLAVLFIFCPHLDAGHYLAAHVGMSLTCIAVAPLAKKFVNPG